MNMAIGGSYLGYPATNSVNAGTVFPSEILVDYVRIYNVTEPLLLSISSSVNAVTVRWPSNIVCELQLQTNSLSLGLGTNWQVQTTNTNQFNLPKVSGGSYFRLISP